MAYLRLNSGCEIQEASTYSVVIKVVAVPVTAQCVVR